MAKTKLTWSGKALSFWKQNRWLDLIVIVIAVMVYFPFLSSWGPMHFDEAIYSDVSANIHSVDDVFSLEYANRQWFEKPPLYFVASAITHQFIKDTKLSSRLPSAIAGVGLVAITYLITIQLFGRSSALVASIILIASDLLLFRARQGTLDVMLCFFIFVGIFCYLQVKHKSIWWIGFWAALGFAILTKGFAALILPSAVAVDLILNKNMKNTIKECWFWMGFAIAGVIAVPWHAVEYIMFGNQFVDIYLGRHVIERSSTAIEGHSSSPLFYLVVLFKHYQPWIWTIPIVAYFIWKKPKIYKYGQSGVLIILAIVTAVLYGFIVQTKLVQYILPILPVAAIFISVTMVYITKLTIKMIKPRYKNSITADII